MFFDQYTPPVEQLHRRFIVTTNNFRATGGGSFPGLDGKNVIMDAPDENREALVQYFRDVKRVDPQRTSTGASSRCLA